MSNAEQLPETINIMGKGSTMTFLRNDTYIAKNYASGAPDADPILVPPHWHETHDEIFKVTQGKLEVTIGPTVRVYTPEDGEAVIPKGIVHSLRSFKGVETTFYERTNPMDDQKEMLFRNLLEKGFPPKIMDGAVTCYYGDTFFVFPIHVMWLEKLVVTLLGGYIAPLLGYRRVHKSLKKAE